jgi:hypothetical protein
MQNIAAAETLQTHDHQNWNRKIAKRKAPMRLDVTLRLLSGQNF